LPYVFTFNNQSIWLYVVMVFVCVRVHIWGKNYGFSTEWSTFARGSAVMVSKTNSLASRLPVWRICLTFFHWY
jgi:hypothetical protein